MPWLWLALRKLRNYPYTVDQGIRDVAAIGSAAVPKLIELLQEGKEEYPKHWDRFRVREAAAIALGKIADERAVQPLILALRYDDGIVADAAQEALRSFETSEAIEALHALAQREQRNYEEQIYFISTLQQTDDRWMAEAVLLASSVSRQLYESSWTMWVLGPKAYRVTCKEIMGSGEMAWSPFPSEEKTYRLAVGTRSFYIQPVPSDFTIPCFLATVPQGKPCAYQVDVKLGFQTWADFPSMQSYLSHLKHWSKVEPGGVTDNDYIEGTRREYALFSPKAGHEMPASIEVEDTNGDMRHVLGVLRLKSELEDGQSAVSTSNPQARTFRAELYLSDTVPTPAPGTALLRAVCWNEGQTEKSMEMIVATILESKPLLEVYSDK